MAEIKGPRLSVVAPYRAKEIPLDSWEAETALDYDKVYARKYSEDFRDDTATVWRSMYEKNLGRKVSRLPPWEVSLSGRKDSEEVKRGSSDMRDLATIHFDRAKDIGALSEQPPFQTAESRRRERKQGRGDSNSKHKHRNHENHHSHHRHKPDKKYPNRQQSR